MAERAKTYTFVTEEATREGVLLRAGVHGPAGSGKTRTMLGLGTFLVKHLNCGPLYVIDTENRSAKRYAHNPHTGTGFHFKHVPMPEDDYSPQAYIAALDHCEREGAGVIIVDGFSQAWNGINGVLEQVDQKAGASRSGNAFTTGWRDMTPIHNRMVQRMLASSAHLLFTLRAKTEYEMKENAAGKREPTKVGMAPIQRDGFDYEPDLYWQMELGATARIEKSRLDGVIGFGDVFPKPGDEFFGLICDWLKGDEAKGEARSLGEAITIAVRKAIEARTKEGYLAARSEVINYCARRGVKQERADAAVAEFKLRVQAAVGPKVADGAPSSGRAAEGAA